MKAQIPLSNGIVVEVEGTTPQECFKQVAAVQATFEDTKCGLCDSSNVLYVVRKIDDNEYFELRCKDCYAKLTFGQGKGDASPLYPKRYVTDAKGKAVKDETTGKAVPLGTKKNGWVKWNPQTQKEE